MSEIVIDAQGLTKRYGAATVVDHISFTVSSGEIFGVLGPNGAGKTTTILMLLGLSDISEGTARVLGHDPMREPLQVKRRVGYLPDAVGFYDHLSASDNLHYTARLMGIPRAERDQRVMAALDRVRAGRSQRKARGDVLARHAPAAWPRGDPDEGRAHRDPRRADLGPRPAGDRRVAGDDPRPQARRRQRRPVVASARPRAERLRPRRACSAPAASR